MTDILLKLFAKGDYKDQKVRSRCGVLSGVVGIVCNLVLFGVKLFAGIITASVSITADAFNNFTDMGSSIVTMLGFKIASMPADSKHPFGHGRVEYMSASLVSVFIIYVGIHILGKSIGKLSAPAVPDASWAAIIILLFSIFVKCWMSVFNLKVSKKIESDALKAVSTDSLNDCISTCTVLLVALICRFCNGFAVVKYLDSVVGIIVALFIVLSGFKSLIETLDPLIGLAPKKETVDKIHQLVMSEPSFLGMHDMIVHNYGPGRSFVSLHVEVSASNDVLDSHEKIDACERIIKEETGIDAVIHMDPIVTDDETVNYVRKVMSEKISEIYEGMTMHDFRMVKGKNQSNLIFDVCIPAKCEMSESQITDSISKAAKEIDNTYVCVITVDHDFGCVQY